MNTKLSLLTLGLSAVMASSAYAGDIKPLHSCAQGTYAFPSPKTISTHTITCPANTTYYEAAVRDRNEAPTQTNPPTLTIQVTKTGFANGTARTDAAEDGSLSLCSIGAGSGFSGMSRVTGGPGLYTVKITKAGSTAAETYDVSHHCIQQVGATLIDLNGTLSAPTQQ